MPKFVVPESIRRRVGETPPAERKAAERLRLADSGGKQIAVNLPVGAVADLERIKARDGVGTKDAIIAALARHAARR